MTTAWEEIGVAVLLDLVNSRQAWQDTIDGDSNDAEIEALVDYTEALEAALAAVGIYLYADGSWGGEPRPAQPTDAASAEGTA